MEKINLGVIYGSRSVEHDVSIVTALQLIENINKNKYNVIPIYICPEGAWYTGEELLNIEIYKKFDDNKAELEKVYISPVANKMELQFEQTTRTIFKKQRKNESLDVVIPVFHGLNGEDGTIQGLLELANIPYTSAGVLGSAVGMDKIVMKAVFKANDFPVLDYMFFNRYQWEKDSEKIIKDIESKLKYPMFVKPANLGSSIGISKAKDREGLKTAVEIASKYDKRIIVENGVQNIMEINCSALGHSDDVKASVCEQPISWEEFLTFDEKYLGGGKGSKTSGSTKGMASLDRKVPAPISEELTKRIQNLTIDIFKTLDCKGVVRIDYIIDKDTDSLYVNEINVIPGSFSFYLWEETGIKYSELIDHIVEYAIKENREKNKNVYSYDSQILKKQTKGTKGAKI